MRMMMIAMYLERKKGVIRVKSEDCGWTVVGWRGVVDNACANKGRSYKIYLSFNYGNGCDRGGACAVSVVRCQCRNLTLR